MKKSEFKALVKECLNESSKEIEQDWVKKDLKELYTDTVATQAYMLKMKKNNRYLNKEKIIIEKIMTHLFGVLEAIPKEIK